MAILIDNGIKTPKHIAASTSDGQCAPRTRRESATSNVQPNAKAIAHPAERGHSRAAHKARAVARAAVCKVCPLGKLDPQYHWDSHKAGRARPVAVLMM